MNTQPPRQHEALSEEEHELARVVRALPGGEPPAALDALILKAATDAVASSHPQKNSRWKKGLLGTSALWLGTAAASVLTVGIGWQVFQSMGSPIYELPDSENVMSAQETDDSHKSETITVDMIPAREPLPTSPAPAAEAELASDMAAATDTDTDDAAASVAKAKPDVLKDEMSARESVARQKMTDGLMAKKSDEDKEIMPRKQAAEQDWIPQTANVLAPAPPPSPAPVASETASPVAAIAAPVSADYAERKEANAVVVTGSRIKQTNLEESGMKAIPRSQIIELSISEDAKLRPDLWLDAIKDRLERNDIEGAKASLKLYKQTHPKLRIPEELKPLLK